MNSRILSSCLCVLITALGLTPDLYAQSRDKTVLVHYMPWYASKTASGYWGWHWTMNHFNPDTVKSNGQREVASHDYPLIDLYDSNDPDALECHVLLMKFAGIDGVIIDWYGIEKFRDYAEIHRNSEHLVKHLNKAGLQFAVCYEDQTIKHMIEEKALPKQRDVAHGQMVLKWLAENWFDDDAYVKIDGRPILLVFGPQYFTKDQWVQLLSGLQHRPLLYALPHLSKEMGLDGAFGWPPVTGGHEITPMVWRQYLTSLYARESVISVAFPAFRDIYKQAQLHDSYGSIDARNGQTFAETFALAQKSNSQIIQIATWNDYGEGTVIEPTKASGYRYLEHVQRNAKSQLPYGPKDLRLPVTLYQLKKRYARDPNRMKQLQMATDLLFAGKCTEAQAAMEAASKGG
ncbi:glycoside hydrolase family 71/99-like protein [Rubinisphaera italica]|uniref:Glycosyl hydrolase family 71 n=1 Tax=Rubinisphaera italica TaxID=2527969 RepID=A0A5C5XIY3_9PLAN|nr:glycoside hydrolase family 71/99-like protein [Rubinisphaera italica]TWT62744.1 hypothetical protein Pan54_34890 [Rubinisphaera italica]